MKVQTREVCLNRGFSAVIIGFGLSFLLLAGCKQSISSSLRASESIEMAPADLLGSLADWSGDPWSYQKVVSLIQGKGLKSVDDVLAHLPAWLMSSFTLIHTSADGEEATDYEHPRVLLFSPDGKFILSYNVRTDINRLRIAQFVDRDNRLALYEIQFDPKGTSLPVFSRENPADCAGCHNDDPKYNIEEYDRWQGWYGSQDDSFKDGSPEDIGLQKLRKRAVSEPRLRHLKFPAEFPNYPYHRFDEIAQKNSVGRGFSSMPNTRLTTAIMRLQARIVHRQLRSHPKYDGIAPLLAFAMLEPKSDVIQFRESVTKTCQSELASKQAASPKLDFAAAIKSISGRAPEEKKLADRYLLIRAIFESAGVDVDEYLDPGGMIRDLTSRPRSARNRMFMDGFFGIRDIVLDLIWRDLARANAKLAALHQPLTMTAGIELATNHWGSEARYNRDYHFRLPQRQIFDGIATAMIAPKGDEFDQACAELQKLASTKLGVTTTQAEMQTKNLTSPLPTSSAEVQRPVSSPGQTP
jgi:hypothetical protein